MRSSSTKNMRKRCIVKFGKGIGLDGWIGGWKEENDKVEEGSSQKTACIRSCVPTCVRQIEGVGNAVAATDKHYYAPTASTFR